MGGSVFEGVPALQTFSITPALNAYLAATQEKRTQETHQSTMNNSAIEALGRLAVSADTPEKWGAFVDRVQQRFPGADLGPYRDFSARDMALAEFDPYFSDRQEAQQLLGRALGGAVGPQRPQQPMPQAPQPQVRVPNAPVVPQPPIPTQGMTGYDPGTDPDVTGGPVVQPRPAGAPMPITPSSASFNDRTLPRGLRNNNPGNIEDGPFARSLPGYAGSDGRFARFATLEDGANAMTRLLSSPNYRNLTLAGAINRWAPPGENDSNAYVSRVAAYTGLDPNAPIPPDQLMNVAEAMAAVENGRTVEFDGIRGVPFEQVAQAGAQMGVSPQLADYYSVLGSPGFEHLPATQQQFVIDQIERLSTQAGPVEGTEINGQLVNPYTGAVIGDYRDQPGVTVRPMTPAERAQWGIPPSDNRPYAMTPEGPKLIGGSGVTVNMPGQPNIGSIPAGWQAVQDANGQWTMAPIPGGPAEAESRAAAQAGETMQENLFGEAQLVNQDIDRAVEQIQAAPWRTTGWTGNVAQALGDPAYKNVAGLLTTVKAHIALDRLQSLKAASPVGASGFGALSQNELNLLEGYMGSLDQAQTADQLTFNLQRIQDSYRRVIQLLAAEYGVDPTAVIGGDSALTNPAPMGAPQRFTPPGGNPAPPAVMTPAAAPAPPNAAPTHIWTPEGGLRPVQ